MIKMSEGSRRRAKKKRKAEKRVSSITTPLGKVPVSSGGYGIG